MNTSTEYMREYRARYGGSAPADKARSRANTAAAKWVYDNHPEVYANVLAQARAALGLGTDIGPLGNFTKPIAHGTCGGYRTHKYRGEQPCRECRDANAEYHRERRRMLRAT